MKRHTFFTATACLFATSIAFATPISCPPALAFSHIQGQTWTISSTYKAQGWWVLPMAPDTSSLTKLNPSSVTDVELAYLPNKT